MGGMTYYVVVAREDGNWLACVPALSGAHTFAGSLPQLVKAVRELIALVEDLPEGAEDDFDIVWGYHMPR